jgi:hypothetical protein
MRTACTFHLTQLVCWARYSHNPHLNRHSLRKRRRAGLSSADNMLIILFICALFRTLHGAPANGFPALDLRDPQVHLGDRGVSDIIISCFATIFACTWSAVHPNIPAPTDCGWTRFKRQFVTMVYALLVPEVITAWALRQRLAAKKIVDEYNIYVATSRCISGSKRTNGLCISS